MVASFRAVAAAALRASLLLPFSTAAHRRAAADAASSSSATYSLSYDGIVSPPDAVVIIENRGVGGGAAAESSGVPSSFAEAATDVIADEAVRIWSGLTEEPEGTAVETRCHRQRDDDDEAAGGRSGSRGGDDGGGRAICSADYVRPGVDLHLEARFFRYRPNGGGGGGDAESASASPDEAERNEEGPTVVISRVDATVTVTTTTDDDDRTPPLAREFLVRLVPAIDSAIGGGGPSSSSSSSSSSWSVRPRPTAAELTEGLRRRERGSEAGAASRPGSEEGDEEERRDRSFPSSPSSLEAVVLSDRSKRNRTRVGVANALRPTGGGAATTSTTTTTAEVWEYLKAGSSAPTVVRSLFLDSTLRATTSIASVAHAEAFVHPALIAHPRPARVAILSAAPLALIREASKHKSVRKIVVVGADSESLELTRRTMPSLDDCGGFLRAAEGGDEGGRCTESDVVQIVDVGVDEWLDRIARSASTSDDDEEEEEHDVDFNEDEYLAHSAVEPKFDVVLLDVDASNEREWLSFPFQHKLWNLLSKESMLVVNSGSAPSMDEDYDKDGVEFRARDRFLRQATREEAFGGFDHGAAVVYDEPLAAPLDTAYVVVFPHWGWQYARFLRKNPASIDLDIVDRFHPSTKEAMPTVVFDGPTHAKYLVPSRAWEHWYCRTAPGKDLPACRVFLPHWFDAARHQSETEVVRDPIKGRALVAKERIRAGNFVLSRDTVMSVRLDFEQWRGLDAFVNDFPDATMYRDLRDLFLAYGYQAEDLGSTGWTVSIACNNTFTNHACATDEANVAGLPHAEINEDGTFNGFSPVASRRSSVFGTLVAAARDIEPGEEILMDYREFRTWDKGREYSSFLDGVCREGEGLVPVVEKEEELNETRRRRGPSTPENKDDQILKSVKKTT